MTVPLVAVGVTSWRREGARLTAGLGVESSAATTGGDFGGSGFGTRCGEGFAEQGAVGISLALGTGSGAIDAGVGYHGCCGI